MPPINWHWLEDLLVRACEVEVRLFGQRHPEERFFAFCLEFDGLTGTFQTSYGTREAVDGAARRLGLELGPDVINYRAVELQPENWTYRGEPAKDPEGHWARMEPLLGQYADLMGDDREPDEAEFYWLRLEYLAECAVRRLIDRDGFRHLWRDEEFVAYPLCQEERLEELEDRLEKLYPAYRRATQEWISQPRAGEFHSGLCEGSCRPKATGPLTRCTHCQGWFCEPCRLRHSHPELAVRQPLFL